ncbi:hypothetical protein BV25DRAFT_1988841 [Artomyces pyxidatus]|uniref:Uncharacterized protein n=1 Tax=Artomyces pyxidatus TaxID=48021 RepID=A0ACB8TC31_9AGAM|nr:hypothetical protein BV25DRAFT_1988841 [Artomyces pyxidatus]
MPSLPLELLHIIVGLTDSTDLSSFRAASKTFCAVATPRLFRVLGCTNTVSSTDSIVALLSCTYLHEYVEEFVYTDWYERPGEESFPWPPEDARVQENIINAISQLKYLPALHTISLTFSPFFLEPTSQYIDVNDEPSASLHLQRAVFSAFTALSNIPTLRSLTLECLTPFPNPIFTQHNFLSFFRGLTRLHLSTVSDTSMEGAVYQDPIVEFYTGAIPLILRAPMSTLTSLALHSDQDVGSLPGLALSELHYPHLTHLSLEQVLFDADTGAEAFILAHASTLTSLRLSLCRVALPEENNAPDRTWADVYGALQEGLVNLRRLEVTESWEGMDWPDGNPDGMKLRYARMDSGYGWNPYFGEHEEDGPGEEIWDAGDVQALEDFRQVVKLRGADG